MPYCIDNLWHIHAHENISSPACLIVVVKSKTENQLIRFVIAYLVADNNVNVKQLMQRETPDFITPDLWPPNSPDLNPVDYRIMWSISLLQERVYRKSVKN